MTKAKEKAIEAFPIVDQQHLRNAFVSGYEQAEKDIKERMMKEAEEYDVDGYGYIIPKVKGGILVAYPFDDNFPRKVKVIVIKDE